MPFSTTLLNLIYTQKQHTHFLSFSFTPTYDFFLQHHIDDDDEISQFRTFVHTFVKNKFYTQPCVYLPYYRDTLAPFFQREIQYHLTVSSFKLNHKKMFVRPPTSDRKENAPLIYNPNHRSSISRQRAALPIFKKRREILYAVEKYKTTILCGDTYVFFRFFFKSL